MEKIGGPKFLFSMLFVFGLCGHLGNCIIEYSKFSERHVCFLIEVLNEFERNADTVLQPGNFNIENINAFRKDTEVNNEDDTQKAVKFMVQFLSLKYCYSFAQGLNALSDKEHSTEARAENEENHDEYRQNLIHLIMYLAVFGADVTTSYDFYIKTLLPIHKLEVRETLHKAFPTVYENYQSILWEAKNGIVDRYTAEKTASFTNNHIEFPENILEQIASVDKFFALLLFGSQGVRYPLGKMDDSFLWDKGTVSDFVKLINDENSSTGGAESSGHTGRLKLIKLIRALEIKMYEICTGKTPPNVNGFPEGSSLALLYLPNTWAHGLQFTEFTGTKYIDSNHNEVTP